MTAYRETLAALRLRISALESELERKNEELKLRESELTERDARLERLRCAVADLKPTRPRTTQPVIRGLGACVLVLLALGLVAGFRHPSASSREMAPSRTAQPRLRIPMSLAVVIDSRLSMEPHLERASRAIVKLAGTLEDDDRIGIVRVDGHGSQVVLPVSTALSARAGLPSVLAGVRVRVPDWPAREQLTVSNGISAAIELLQRWTPDARIVVVTDGMDASWEMAEGTAEYAASRGFRVSALGAGQFVSGYPESIARAGHGSFARLGDAPALDRFINEQRN